MRALRLLTVLFAAPISLLAQAWLSPQGDGSVTVLYQYSIDRLHAYSDGRTKDLGHMYWDTVVLDTDYSFTDRLALKVSLPYIDGKYVGHSPHTMVRGDPTTAVAEDNGSYHGTVQDVRVNVRYRVTKGEWKVVPLFEASIPTTSYPVFLHAVLGTDSREYRAGVNVGRALNPVLPKAYFQAQYAFGVSQQFANITPKVSYGEFQLGYFLTRRIALQSSAVGFYSHNGILWNYDLFPNDLTQAQWLNHIRVSRGKQLDVGGGIAYSFNRSTSVVVSMSHSLWGENTHLRYLVTTVGFVKAFSTRREGDGPPQTALLPQPKKALVCTCAKSN
jgi:hypothetical protein